MKNLLMLCLLVLSPPLLAQSTINTHNSYFLLADATPPSDILFSVNNLMPINPYHNEQINSQWLSESELMNKSVELDEFSSLTLINQLRELDAAVPFNVSHNATIERFIRVYLKDRREYLNKILGKSAYYFPIFEQHLDTYDLPLELKYLAVVESALNPIAVSPSGAKGLWQFMYGTGTENHLYIDSYVDERFDPIKSTRAACEYLQSLYHMFNDWDLALAAYNSGPGNVKKAIKRAGGNKNYWEIRRFLPKETSSYVPAFYATMYLFTYANYHGLSPKKGALSFVDIDTVQLKGSLSFETIKRSTGIDNELLKSLNPQYKKEVIPFVKNKKMTLSLPTYLMPDFIEKERALYQEGLGKHKLKSSSKVIAVTAANSYLVRQGDNLNSIAKSHHISLEQLKTWNGLETNFLISGQRLVITSKKELNPGPIDRDQNSIQASKTKVNILSTSKNYTVQYGDTLFKISRKFGNVSVSELRNMNNLNDINYLKPGTQLRIKID